MKNFPRLLPLPCAETETDRLLRETNDEYEITQAEGDADFYKSFPHLKLPEENQYDQQTIIRYRELLSTAQGLVGDLARFIETRSDVPYPQFALGTALGCLASVMQGTYACPTVKLGKHAGGLDNNFYLIASPGGGKEAYRSALQIILNEVDPFLITGAPGTSHALAKHLYVSNSLCIVIDEMQDFLQALTGKTTSEHKTKIASDIKQLSNSLNFFEQADSKKICYPRTHDPRLTMFGVGTKDGFTQLLAADLVGGGFISRFTVIPYVSIPDLSSKSHGRISNASDVPTEIIDKLKDIYRLGLTKHHDKTGNKQTEDRVAFANLGTDGASTLIHKPTHNPFAKILTFTPAAKKHLLAFELKNHRIYQRLDQIGGVQGAPGSIITRSFRLACKMASYHAVGRLPPGETTVDITDAIWGINFATTHQDYLCHLIRGNTGTDPSERARNKIKEYVSVLSPDQQISYTTLRRLVGDKTDRDKMRGILDTLLSDEILERIEKKNGEWQPCVIQDCPKQAGKMTFRRK